MKDFFGVVGVIVLVVAAIAGLSIGSYHLYAYLAPQYEATRRDVMLQSRAYSEGAQRNLYRLKIQHDEATSDAAKATIRLAAQHECEAMDRSRLAPELANFCNPLTR